MNTTLNNILSIEALFANNLISYDDYFMHYRNGKNIIEEHRTYNKQEKKNKKIIDIAIKTAAMPMASDWLLYLDCLSGQETEATLTVVKHALQVIFAYGLTYADVEKHHKRQQSKTDEPIRFIDRPHFIAVETEELPF